MLERPADTPIKASRTALADASFPDQRNRGIMAIPVPHRNRKARHLWTNSGISRTTPGRMLQMP
jgi:hypothetical protein